MDQQEQVEWDDVNKLLQHHGFKPVYFADPVENKSLNDLVLLDKKSAVEIRQTLRTMLTDSERRQTLIQELIKTNNLLKEDVQQHMGRAAQQSQRVSELEGLLDVVKTRVQDLEDRCIGKAAQQQSHTKQLQHERLEAQLLCHSLEQKLNKQKEEMAQLQKRLYFTIKEEERRLARQKQTFELVCNKISQQESPTEQQVLDVIDFYETKMSRLLDELRSAKGEPEVSEGIQDPQTKKTSSHVTKSFKTILKAYQDQQRGSKTQINELKKEVERLKHELETRPTLKDVKFYKHKLRRLEILHKNNLTRFPKDDGRLETSENISELCSKYQKILNDISAVVTNPRAPLRLLRQKAPSAGLEPAEFQTLVPTLEVWAQQLHLLKDLQQSLNQLTRTLTPWQTPDSACNATETLKVEDMMLQVDTMLENTPTVDEKVLRSPTRFTLGSMVSHFQKLFDVKSLSGVYPRMNELYTRLGEMTNAMRNLRDVLDLDSRAPPAQIVNHVSRLVSSSENMTGLNNLLGDDDIDSIIVKVKQHDEFFPAFHTLIMDILDTLGVSHLDDILPAVKSLKQTAE
ncbi:centrosomal protein of 70 kDa [Cheilinus undulatus]|uniref:centrosomal protein of 70 kDa n=1 Tax=Cheilinus undulatus TaxID=241271 RepID=UPI001BD2DF50|nr:centrosomal protein of 70 kDa [Cheilinus undulatus]XP_041637956.1 centrosomal protein of 70 kDa [Cheilinus undulatus]XP_041637957.1 centrosomal protein of 70 kDa [Cheilinus undulatus]